jgi:hypothetical protein
MAVLFSNPVFSQLRMQSLESGTTYHHSASGRAQATA